MPVRAAVAFALCLVIAACTSTPPREVRPTPPSEFAIGSESDPDARRNWYWQQRTYPTGTVPAEAHRNAVRRELDATRALAEGEAVWTNVGPAPLRNVPLGLTSTHHASGRTLAVALHPTDPSIIVIGTAMGGIWKSVDGGQSFYSTGPEQVMPSLAVNVLRYSPTDANVLYAGTGEPHGSSSMYGSGLLRSTDGGETWHQLPMRGEGWDFEYTSVTGLQFDARDGDTLYITTATVVATLFKTPPVLPQAGLFKSTDGGTTWRLLRAAVKHPGPTGSVGFMDLEYGGAVAPDLFYVSEFHGGILRSEDGGATFKYITPQKANGFGTFPVTIDELAYYDSRASKYLRLKRFPNDPSIHDFRRVEIGMAPSNPQVLFAGYESSTNRLDYNHNGIADSGDRSHVTSLLFKSEDGGDTWRWLGTIFDGVPDYCARQCQFDNVITINPNDENEILLGGMANYVFAQPYPLENPERITEMPWRGMVYRSIDGGKTWADLTPHCGSVSTEPHELADAVPVYRCEQEDPTRVIHPDIHAIAFGKDRSLYVATDGGLYRAVPDRVTPRARRRAVAQPPYIPGADVTYRWQPLNNGVSTLQFYRIAVHPTEPNVLLGGMQDNASGYWNGESWEGWGGGDGTIAEFDPIDPRIVYLGIQFMVFRHMNGGSKEFTEPAGWVTVFDPSKVALGEFTSFVPVFAVDPVEPAILYGGTDKAIYRSTDRGASFTRVGTTHNTDGVVSSIAVSAADHNRVWVSTAKGKIYRYDLAGAQPVITDVSAGLPGRHATQVVAGIDGPNTAYAVFSGYDANTPATPGKVFLTVDGGATWKNITANLPDVPASAIALDPVDVNRLWIAQDTAVYSTRDRGATWTSERRNMPIVGILDIQYDRNSGNLVAATHGRGVWRLPAGTAASATK